MCASSCWKRRTLVSPLSVPDSSFLWRTPKSASLKGSSLHERGLWPNIRLRGRAGAAKRHETCITYRFATLWERCFGDIARDPSLPVSGAVHGLEHEDVVFHGEGEDVLAVVLPVAGCLPQFAVVDVGGGHFLIASPPVLVLENKRERHKTTSTISKIPRMQIQFSKGEIPNSNVMFKVKCSQKHFWQYVVFYTAISDVIMILHRFCAMYARRSLARSAVSVCVCVSCDKTCQHISLGDVTRDQILCSHTKTSVKSALNRETSAHSRCRST